MTLNTREFTHLAVTVTVVTVESHAAIGNVIRQVQRWILPFAVMQHVAQVFQRQLSYVCCEVIVRAHRDTADQLQYTAAKEVFNGSM